MSFGQIFSCWKCVCMIGLYLLTVSSESSGVPQIVGRPGNINIGGGGPGLNMGRDGAPPTVRHPETENGVTYSYDENMTEISEASATHQVFDFIKSQPNSNSQPVNRDDLLSLEFKLYHIVNFDDVTQTVDIKVRLSVGWQDDRIAWNKKLPHVPVEQVRFFEGPYTLGVLWDPEVKIQQSLGMPIPFAKMHYQITEAGHINMRHYIILRITCPMSVKDFPFDIQTCELTFSCTACYFPKRSKANRDVQFWNKQGLEAENDDSYKGIGGQENNKFVLEELSIRWKEWKPIVTIRAKRRYEYYLFYLIGPSLVITAVACLQFALPAAGGEKVTVGVTCLLSMTVFMIVLQQNLAPDTNGSLPLLGMFFGVLTVVIMVTTAMSSMIVMIHFSGQSVGAEMPGVFLLRISLFVAWILCRRRVIRLLSRFIKERQKLNAEKRLKNNLKSNLKNNLKTNLKTKKPDRLKDTNHIGHFHCPPSSRQTFSSIGQIPPSFNQPPSPVICPRLRNGYGRPHKPQVQEGDSLSLDPEALPWLKETSETSLDLALNPKYPETYEEKQKITHKGTIVKSNIKTTGRTRVSPDLEEGNRPRYCRIHGRLSDKDERHFHKTFSRNSLYDHCQHFDNKEEIPQEFEKAHGQFAKQILIQPSNQIQNQIGQSYIRKRPSSLAEKKVYDALNLDMEGIGMGIGEGRNTAPYQCDFGYNNSILNSSPKEDEGRRPNRLVMESWQVIAEVVNSLCWLIAVGCIIAINYVFLISPLNRRP